MIKCYRLHLYIELIGKYAAPTQSMVEIIIFFIKKEWNKQYMYIYS